MPEPPDPPLSDGLVLLRPPGEGDLAEIVTACRDPEIPRWTQVPDAYTEEDGRAFLRDSAAGWADGTRATFAVTDASTGELLGCAGLVRIAGSVGEVGYWMAPGARGRGVATRAVGLIAAWAFGVAGLEQLELFAEPANGPSIRVAEKAGFLREGVVRPGREIKGRRPDLVRFSLGPGELA